MKILNLIFIFIASNLICFPSPVSAAVKIIDPEGFVRDQYENRLNKNKIHEKLFLTHNKNQKHTL